MMESKNDGIEDGDGEITEFEFIKFMLTTAGMADEDTLESLHARVNSSDELDPNHLC